MSAADAILVLVGTSAVGLALPACIEENPNWLMPEPSSSGGSGSSTIDATSAGSDGASSGDPTNAASDTGAATDSGTTAGDTGAADCEPACDPLVELCWEAMCTCRDGLSVCDGMCVPLSNDPMHCGACTMMCLSGFCGGGECNTPSCVGFPDICGGACTDVISDPMHCGGCDKPCPPNQLCVAGSCVAYELPGCFECPCPECGALNCCASTYLERPICVAVEC